MVSVAAAADSEDVGAPAVGQGHLEQHGIAGLAHQPAGAAAHRDRDFRAPRRGSGEGPGHRGRGAHGRQDRRAAARACGGISSSGRSGCGLNWSASASARLRSASAILSRPPSRARPGCRGCRRARRAAAICSLRPGRVCRPRRRSGTAPAHAAPRACPGSRRGVPLQRLLRIARHAGAGEIGVGELELRRGDAGVRRGGLVPGGRRLQDLALRPPCRAGRACWPRGRPSPAPLRARRISRRRAARLGRDGSLRTPLPSFSARP